MVHPHPPETLVPEPVDRAPGGVAVRVDDGDRGAEDALTRERAELAEVGLDVGAEHAVEQVRRHERAVEQGADEPDQIVGGGHEAAAAEGVARRVQVEHVAPVEVLVQPHRSVGGYRFAALEPGVDEADAVVADEVAVGDGERGAGVVLDGAGEEGEAGVAVVEAFAGRGDERAVAQRELDELGGGPDVLRVAADAAAVLGIATEVVQTGDVSEQAIDRDGVAGRAVDRTDEEVAEVGRQVRLDRVVEGESAVVYETQDAHGGEGLGDARDPEAVGGEGRLGTSGAVATHASPVQAEGRALHLEHHGRSGIGHGGDDVVERALQSVDETGGHGVGVRRGAGTCRLLHERYRTDMRDVASPQREGVWMSRTDEDRAAPVGEADGVTTPLASLLGALSDAVLDLEVAPLGVEVPIGDVVIVDRAVDGDVHAGDLVLGVGLAPDDAATLATIDRLTAAGAVGLVLRSSEPLPTVVRRHAERVGLTLLRTGPHVGWGRIYTLVRTALAAHVVDAHAMPGDAGADGTPPLGDLFALANAIAAAVGGATTIEDRHLQVLAHSNLGHPVDQIRLDSIVGRRVPDEVRADTHELYRRVWRATGTYRVRAHEPSGSRPRLGVAVRAGAEVLGTIWVIEGDEPFTPADHHALEESARVAALHLLRHAAAGDVERRRRGELAASVLDGRVPFSTAAAALGVEGTTHVTVVAFDASASDDGVQDVQVIERLADLVALHLESYRRSAAITTLGRRVYALVAEPDTATTPRRRAVVDEIVERARHSLQRRVVCGIGATVTDHRDVVTSREEADSVIRVLRRGGEANVAHIDDVRTSVVLDRLRTVVSGDTRLQAGLLERLRAHDERHHSDYVVTVAAYLSAFGAVAEAAERLVLHPNTLRYRLRRIAESTGVDLADPEARFVLELELRMAGLMGVTT